MTWTLGELKIPLLAKAARSGAPEGFVESRFLTGAAHRFGMTSGVVGSSKVKIPTSRNPLGAGAVLKIPTQAKTGLEWGTLGEKSPRVKVPTLSAKDADKGGATAGLGIGECWKFENQNPHSS
jgi:hypothetical protein